MSDHDEKRSSRSLSSGKQSGRSYSSHSRSRSHERQRRRSYSRSRSRSRSSRRDKRRHRRDSRSRSRSRSGSPRRRRHYRRDSRSRSHSPMSFRRRHQGDRDRPDESRCLGVFGLSLDTTERDLKHLFGEHGQIENANIVYDKQNGKSRGFGFVYFKHLDDAVEAKNECSGISLDGRTIRVDYSITQRAHTPTPGVYLGRASASSYRRYSSPSSSRNHRDRSP